MTDGGWKSVLGLSCSYLSGQHVYAIVVGPVSLLGLLCDTDLVFDARVFGMPVIYCCGIYEHRVCIALSGKGAERSSSWIFNNFCNISVQVI